MIVHIGFPKCASTSLQSLFALSGARFLGCNPKAAAGEFYDPVLGHGMESIFRFGGEEQFSAFAAQVRPALEQIDGEADGQSILSYENISFRLTPWDLPTDIKIARLGRLIPENPRIVVVFRPVQDFVVSLYKNHLSFGYTGGFEDFLHEIDVLRDYGWLADLDVSLLVKRLNVAFGGNCDIVLADLGTPDMPKRLFGFLGLAYKGSDDVRLNRSPDEWETAQLRAHNAALPHRQQLLDWLELHRVFPRGTMPEAALFRMSRARIAQNEALKAANMSDVFCRDAFEWPEAFEQMEAKNKAFISGVLGDQRIVLI
ncbi:MAG: hypothetical protein KDI13_01635 [Alphaproteobacteria bacterium]|nr:hypothetical protein [Alphaproteobacteria bacterium]